MAARLNASTTRKRNPTSAPPRDSSPGDNAAAVEEADRIQLISIMSKLSTAEDQIEVAKAPLKAAQKARSQVIGLGKAAGYTAKELTARLDEMRRGSRENAEQEARERKHRRWLGIISDDQAKLQLGDSTPQEAKDEAHWKAEGYKAGLRQMAPKPPPECPERFTQAWMKEQNRGIVEVTTANAPKALSVREQAAKDFAEDEPEIDVEAAARKLKNDPKFMDRGPPENEHHGAEMVAAASIPEGASTNSDPDDGFEATPEELAGQAARTAIVDAREGRTTGEGDIV